MESINNKNIHNNEVDELRAKKENAKRRIVSGNNLSQVNKVECSQCSAKFKDFDVVFVESVSRYLQCCPNCKANLAETTFQPLDIYGRRMDDNE